MGDGDNKSGSGSTSSSPLNSNCTQVPMPTMSGLHVGAPIANISLQPELQCQQTPINYVTPTPQASPLTNFTPPAPTPTSRPASTRQPPAKLDRPALDWRVSGPFPQTLFLGCSVVDFSTNLGWGSTSEGSTLTVTLIRDTMPTFSVSASSIADNSSRYMGMNYAALKSAAEAVRDVPNHFYNVMKPSRALVESLQTALANLPYNYTEAQYRAVMDAHTWSPPEPFKDVNGGPIIPGKLYYEYNTRTHTYEQKYWLGPDPGFVADKDIGGNQFTYLGMSGWNINIIGAPVRFVVDEFVFCGVVTDWKKTINSGGTQYTVTIQTPTYLLRNASLILGHYSGSVFTKGLASVIAPAGRTEFDNSIPLTPWERYYQAAYPNAFASFTRTYKNYISGPVNITDAYVGNSFAASSFANTSWQGNIKNDGNLPNVINIYGYLESFGPGYFGGSKQNDMGIKYNLLIGTLNAMLGTPSPSPFNPFGGLVGVCAEPPFKNPSNADHNWTNVFSINDCPQVNDSVSTPNSTAAAQNVSDSNTTILRNTPASYITTIYATGKTMFDFGFIPPTMSSTSSTYKQLYYLDLTELPVMPDLLRYDSNGSPVATIAEFIDDICEKGGCEYFWEMINLPAAGIGYPTGVGSYNILKIRTVSRKTSPPDNVVEEYLRGFIGNKTQLDYGKEFNGEAKTRVLILGGKQKRLVQVKNYRLGRSQSAHIYSPFTRKFVILDTQEKNKIKIPNLGSTRHPLTLVRGAENTNLNEIDNGFFSDDYNWRYTSYGGGGGGMPGQAGGEQNRADDENPAVNVNSGGGGAFATARVRGNKTSTTESSWTFIGNYYYSSTLAFNRFKDITSYKTRANNNENSGGGKKTFSYVLQKRVDSSYIDITSFIDSPCSYNASAVKSWFKLKTTQYSWKNTAARPSQQQAYRKGDTSNLGVDYAKNRDRVRTRITTLNRFFPLMHDVICPYFGSYKYLPLDGWGNVYNNAGYIQTPRPVWYDMWTNQIVVVFGIGDLPRTRMLLSGTYAGGTSFIVTESELRAALAGYDSWLAYLGAKLFKPDIVHMIKAVLCPMSGTAMPSATDPPNQAQNNGGIPNRQNDPANVQQGQMVGVDGAVQAAVPATNFISDVDNVNECDYCQIFMSIFRLPKINLANGSVLYAKPIMNTKTGLAGAVFDDVYILWQFFNKIANDYYGRQFMVKMPMVRTYVDKNIYVIDEGYSNSLLYGDNMRIMEGDGKIYHNYKISPQGAWEEAGNMIDDQIVIGGWYANIFQNEQGLIEPILGFWSSMGFDYESYFICQLLNQGNGVDPEQTKGAYFKIGDMIHTTRVCLDGVIGAPVNAINDNSPSQPVKDPFNNPQRGIV